MTPLVFDPENLVSFIEELRLLGFDISTDQYTAAQDLLITLVAHGHVPAEQQNLSTWLAPVLCTSPGEQRIFHETLEQWLAQQSQYTTESNDAERRESPDSRSEVKEAKKKSNRRLRTWLAATAAVLILAATAMVVVRSKVPQAPQSLFGYVVDKDNTPVPDATVLLGKQTTASDKEGKFSITYSQRDLPTVINVSHPGYKTLDFELNAANNKLPIHITLSAERGIPASVTKPKAANKPLQSVIPAEEPDWTSEPQSTSQEPRRWRKLYQNYFELVLLGMLLLPFAVLAAYWLRRFHNVRRLRLRRQSAADGDSLFHIMVKDAADQLFRGQSFRRVAQELRRHRQFGSDQIDPPPTVNATIRNGGWFTPVYGLRREQPEYLALIDCASFDDQQAHLENALVNRLVNDGVVVERYYFHGSPLVCRQENPKGPRIHLQELTARHPNYNLLLFSDGDGLVNPSTLEPQGWLDLLNPWPVLALLTSKDPLDWGYHERALSEEGFVVVPASKAGLASLTETINTGKVTRPGNGDKSHPFPRMLNERPGRWLESHEPERAVVNQLCFQLRRFLGDEGYYLLGACAVYPMLFWELSVYLGYKTGSDNLEERLRPLVQLPWFRHGSLPDWLRLRLISALPKKYEELTREALVELLLSSLKKDGGRFFGLPYARREEQNSDEHGWKALRHSFIRSVRAWNVRTLWHTIIRFEPKQSALRDYVFLTFMSGRKPSQLSLNVPDVLQRMLFPQGQPALGLRPFTALLLAALCSTVVATGWKLWSTTDTYPMAASHYIKKGDGLADDNRWAEAELAYRHATRLNTDNGLQHYRLLIALDENHKYQEWFVENRLLNDMGKWGEIEAENRLAIALQPQSAWRHRLLGDALKRELKYEEAEYELRSAIRIAPEYAIAHNDLGIILHLREKNADAEAEFRESIRLDPNYNFAYLGLAISLSAQGKYAAAESESRKAIRLDPDAFGTHSVLGNALFGEKKYAEAEFEYREAIRVDPESPVIHWCLGGVLYEEEKYAESEAAFRECIRLDPEIAGPHNGLGNALYSQDKYAEAEIEYRVAISLDPNKAIYHSNLAGALYDQNKYAEAKIEYRKAITIDPNSKEARDALGRLFKQKQTMSDMDAKQVQP